MRLQYHWWVSDLPFRSYRRSKSYTGFAPSAKPYPGESPPRRGVPLPPPGEAPWEPQGESPPPRGGGGMVYISIAVFPSVYSLLPTTLIENRIIRYRTIVSASIWTRFIRRKYSTMLPYRREKNYIVILLLKSYRQVRENHGNRSNRYPKS